MDVAPAASSGERCTACGEQLASHRRDCIVCGAANEVPNVRIAQSSAEGAALRARLDTAEISARAKGCLTTLNEFGVAVLSSRAVIARNIGQVHDIAKSDNELYVPFHQRVAAGAQVPRNNPWDPGRPAVEATIFPYYHQEISYAALSLDCRGLTAYGAYSIVLKDQAIALRASVFEENPFLFTKRHKILAGQPCIAGYRATWSARDILAKAKLHHLISSSTTPDKFAGILMVQGLGTGDPDYVEVHIFGSIHRRAIERVIGPAPKSRADKDILKSVEKALAQVGATLEVV